MPVNYEQERLLRQVIQAFVRAVDDRDSSLPKIKLVKLLYLLDLASWRRNGRLATGLDWVFFHYGPWSAALEPVLERAEGQYFTQVGLPFSEIHRLQTKFKQLEQGDIPLINEVVYLYKPIRFVTDEPIEDEDVRQLVSEIASRWAAATSEEILDHVYATLPVSNGTRYRPIDWNLAEREAGLFGNKARDFTISDGVRGEVERAWRSWDQTGRDRWSTAYQAEEHFFDEVFAAAMARMDADEGSDAVHQFRIVGALPKPQLGPRDD